ncbi:Control of competence regulator ComK, YlbF/YmcA [Lachnospiraceae bacterium XPB1003]|nr:Control of competence regulator ComK, YlbF/YmcA [Lachnospiraceae bacterium XPB1003]
MVEVENELYVLVEAVKHSNIYKEYDRCKKTLKAEPELFRRVNVFRIESYKLNQQPDDGTLQDRIEKFQEDNLELTEEPRVRAFLDAELGLCRMIQEINTRLVRGIDFE